VSSSPRIEQGLAALRAGDAASARRAFESALAEVESGEVLEGLAEALYLEREYAAAADHYERAYSAYRRERDNLAAGRAARMVAWITGSVFGDWAVQSGWFARARTILEEAGEDRREHGWVLTMRSFSEPDAQAREALLREAIALGRRFGDPNIEFEALAYLGCLLIMTDRAEQGLAFLDEALAAACAGELTDLAVVDSMFCGLFWACELVNDVPRAEQWMRAAADLMKRRNVVAAFCRAHYGGILTAAGRWDEAETELVNATGHFDRGMRARRSAAAIRLADLRVRQGRLEEAAQLLVGLESHPDAVRTLAALHLGRGEVALARDLLERATAGPDDEVPAVGEFTMVGPLLALLVDVHLEEGKVAAAARVAERLARIAAAQRGPYLRAAAAFALGRLRVASGEGDARPYLHDALEGFARAELPMELARARLELARALAERSPEVAIAEAKAALEDFERLEANRRDIEGNYMKMFEMAPAFAERVRAARREDRFVGTAVPNFFRKPYGPGWALVGDAGYNRDFITAQGMHDAFRDAELCATALDETFLGARPFEVAMEGYRSTRDQQVLPMYELTCQLATLEPPPPELQQLLAAVHGNQQAMDEFARVNAGVLSPAEFFSEANVGRIMSQAAAAAPHA
jgi:tetratricopeptide (TPR) repeat protein